MIKVMIADDQELIRQSLEIVLSAHEDINVVSTACDGFEVLEKVKENKPDVILMDIRMPKMDGVYCTKMIKEQYPQIKIIILTTFDDDEFVFSALKYGASGYLLKGVSMEELFRLAKCASFDEVEVFLSTHNEAYTRKNKTDITRTPITGWFSLKGVADGGGYLQDKLR